MGHALLPAGLREWRVDDAPRLVQAWGDTEIAKWNAVPAEPTLATAVRWIEGVAARRERRLSFDFVIESPDDALVVGEVGLSGFSDQHRGALIGYWLLPQARGRGLVAPAVHSVADWAHSALELDVIVARCHETNHASQAVATRAGFRHEANDPAGYKLFRSRTREP